MVQADALEDVDERDPQLGDDDLPRQRRRPELLGVEPTGEHDQRAGRVVRGGRRVQLGRELVQELRELLR